MNMYIHCEVVRSLSDLLCQKIGAPEERKIRQ